MGSSKVDYRRAEKELVEGYAEGDKKGDRVGVDVFLGVGVKVDIGGSDVGGRSFSSATAR